MSRYVNGVKMGFAMAAYAEEYTKRLKQEEEEREKEQLQECVKFSDIDIGGVDGNEISFDVNEGFNVNIYVDGELVYGPINGECTIAIE